MIVNGLMSGRSITAWARSAACGAGFTVGLALLVLILVFQAPAKAAARNHRTITLRAKFTPVPGVWFMNSSRYVFISTGLGTGVVIDDRTGRQTALTLPSGCESLSTIGGPWLVLGCSPRQELYKMATGQTTPFVPSPALEQPPISLCSVIACGPVGGIVKIGSDWAELVLANSDPEHILDQFAFQNLQTGQAVANPAGGTTTVDLNSPALAEKVCAPLRVPTWRRVYGQAPGTLTPIGRGFEIADGNNSYLERCGTHLHQLLGSDLSYNCAPPACGPTGNPHLVVFGEPQTRTGSFRVDGMFLPSRQRFAIPIPTQVAGQVGLAARHLYLGGEGTGIWTTPIPRPPVPHPKKR